MRCQTCNKSWTGSKLEHCKVCHETFNNTRAGDKHRAVAFKYTIVRFGERLDQVMEDEVAKAVADGAVVVSRNNEQSYCLNAKEMLAKGMSQEKNGCWNSGGNWSGASWNSVN